MVTRCLPSSDITFGMSQEDGRHYSAVKEASSFPKKKLCGKCDKPSLARQYPWDLVASWNPYSFISNAES